jgi:hypothetical protein
VRGGKAIGGVLLTALLVGGCGGNDGNSHDGETNASKAPDQTEPPADLNVPSAYTADKGWDTTLNWVPASVTTVPVTVAPKAGAVTVMQAASNGYVIRTRAADSGRVLWASEPWHPPTPVEGAEGDPENGEAAEIPDVTGVEQDGRGYVVAYAHGMRGKDALHEGTEVVRLAVYPADASGSSVAPLREIDVPVSAGPGHVRVRGTGGRLLVGWGEEALFPRWSAAVDLATGNVTEHGDANKLLPQCEEAPLCTSSRVVSATVHGPLVAMGGGGFGVPGRWFSNTVRPEGVEAKSGFLGEWNGSVYGVVAGHVLSGWEADGSGNANDPVWTVHDLSTGKVLATMECDYDPADSRKGTRDHALVSSPNGRFLAAGPVAFDLERKKGLCLEGDGNRKTILVSSIHDDGAAYGLVEETSGSGGADAVTALLDLTTGTGDPKVLGTGVVLPYTTGVDGSGLFLNREADGAIRVSLRPQR